VQLPTSYEYGASQEHRCARDGKDGNPRDFRVYTGAPGFRPGPREMTRTQARVDRDGPHRQCHIRNLLSATTTRTCAVPLTPGVCARDGTDVNPTRDDGGEARLGTVPADYGGGAAAEQVVEIESIT